MFRAIILIAVMSAANFAFAQNENTLELVVKDNATKENIVGATLLVADPEISVRTDIRGRGELRDIPNGTQTIEVSFPGYETASLKLTFPLVDQTERTIFLTVNNDVGEVTVTSTRTGREIEDSPTRVEAIDEEEIDEKISMRPANVSMVLHESTGIQVQQTSATSNTQSVRIQGLDGRYTQILKDGFPAFGGFSGSLSILEIPPLDLKQVEVIKGPSATLFGQGAIAGVVNFITKDPEEKPVTTLILNQTSALGSDFSIFNSQKFKRFGYTLLGSANYQREYDVDDDNFTELPRTHAFAVSPKLLFYIDGNTTLTAGNSTSYQNRKGGDVFVIRGNADTTHQYFEKNISFRNVTTINFDRQLGNGDRIVAKQSVALFNRELNAPGYRFKGRQFGSYTDVSYFRPVGKHALVFGATANYDRFSETPNGTNPLDRSETRGTIGGFLQDTIDLNEKLSLEAGFRLDRAKDYGTFALPRVSLLYRFTRNLTTRIGFGLGYKTPSIFTEDAEELLFQNVLPIGSGLKAERSRGGTFDINYRNTVGEKFAYSINQLFFFTTISDPLVLSPVTGGFYRFENADSPIISRGFETNAKFSYDLAKLFIGYTFTDAKAGYIVGDRTLPLIPRSKINSALVFEKPESFKAGVEMYFASRQTLSDQTKTRSLFEIGLFGEKTFGKFSIFINAENLTDVRQGRYSQVVIPPSQNPTFVEIYTHTEGRILNGGVKIRL
ncbi:MAG: TonB-dependent receptor [Acidobacteriota bacterium]